MPDSRRFLRTALLFVVPLAAALVGVEARMSAVPNAYTYKQDMVDAMRDSTEVLVLGSSHEFEGVDTDVFDRPGVNLAMPSQSLTQSAEIALQYLQIRRLPGGATGATLALPKLRYVMLGVSYYSLAYRMSVTGDDRLGFYMRAYRVFGDTTLGDRLTPSNYLYVGIYGWPAVQALFRDRPSDYVGKLNRTGSYHGPPGPPPDAPPNTFEATAGPRARYHQSIGREANVPLNLAFMRRLAEECRTRNVTLVLFTSPVTPQYADAFGDAARHDRRVRIEEFSREFSVRYVDYSRSPAFGWRDFANADHLNGAGAARFGHMLSGVLSN